MKIYCLIAVGGSLTDEVADFLFKSAQEIIKRKDRNGRLNLKSLGLTGEIKTDYKVGFMGAVVGIIFSANFDWEEGSIKTDFIVRPAPREEEMEGSRWVKVPFFPVRNFDPVLN